MGSLTKNATVYFEPAFHNVLKMRAASYDTSISEFVNEAVRLLMNEDKQDLEAIKSRVNAPKLSYETMRMGINFHNTKEKI